MDLKKAISLIAFGFLFVFVNINLSFNGLSINIMPQFIGWILLFLAFVPVGPYMQGRSYMQWIPLVMALVSAGTWYLDAFMPGLENPIVEVLRFIFNIVSAVYWYIMFGILEKIANDTGSTRGPRINVIKVVSLVLYVTISIFTLLVAKVELAFLAILILLLGIALIVLVVIALFTLFGLRKDILRQNEQNLIDQVRENQ